MRSYVQGVLGSRPSIVCTKQGGLRGFDTLSLQQRQVTTWHFWRKHACDHCSITPRSGNLVTVGPAEQACVETDLEQQLAD